MRKTKCFQNAFSREDEKKNREILVQNIGGRKLTVRCCRSAENLSNQQLVCAVLKWGVLQ